jgi:hypothetical protein
MKCIYQQHFNFSKLRFFVEVSAKGDELSLIGAIDTDTSSETVITRDDGAIYCTYVPSIDFLRHRNLTYWQTETDIHHHQ